MPFFLTHIFCSFDLNNNGKIFITDYLNAY